MNCLFEIIRDIAIFPLGYKIIDAISGGDKIDSTWWFVIVSTLEFHVGYSHRPNAPKGTNVKLLRSNKQPVYQLTTD